MRGQEPRPDRRADRGAPHVVIVGGGFAGLAAARALRRAPVRVTLIDRHNHHLFQPLLYQVATAALSPAEIAWPIRHILERQANLDVVLAIVDAIDFDAREVRAGAMVWRYDSLVVATGAQHSYFGMDQWEVHAPGLKTIDDALLLRRRILAAFERAEACLDDAEQQRLLNFVVIGGGPTGVEMAGAIAELARDALPREFRHVDTRRARVFLIEAGERILPALDPRLGHYAERALETLGVTVLTGQAVTGCGEMGVDLGNGRIEAGTLVWAAGVRAGALLAALPGEHDRAGRIRVSPDLSHPSHPEVYIVGDAAAVADEHGRPVPGLAPAAKQAGRHAGRAIAARFGIGRHPGPFRYRQAGNLATIGRAAAVVELGRFRLTGFIGWLFWSVAHVYFLIGLRNRLAVAFSWAWSWFSRDRPARLITNDLDR